MSKQRTYIHIISCTDSMMWYAKHVGKSFPLLINSRNEYVVRASDGYSNIVLKKDGRMFEKACNNGG